MSTADDIRSEVEEILKILLHKNECYGDSAVNPVRVFSKASAVEQILVRIDDKLSRIVRGRSGGEDVELDLIGYFILLRIARRYEAEGTIVRTGRLGDIVRSVQRPRWHFAVIIALWVTLATFCFWLWNS